MKKVFSICLAIMLLVISCPSLAEDKTELTLLRLGDLVKVEPIFTPIVEGFEKEYPQYEVKFEAMGWSEAVTKLPLLAAQGQLPDVYFVNTWNLAFDGYLMDLNDMLAADKTLSADLPESILSTCRLSGGEAALIDGSTGLHYFFHMTFPLLKSVLMMSGTILMAWSFTIFDLVYVITAGGPLNKTNLISIMIYKQAFVNNKMGTASAIAIFTMAFVSMIAFFLMRKNIKENSL